MLNILCTHKHKPKLSVAMLELEATGVVAVLLLMLIVGGWLQLTAGADDDNNGCSDFAIPLVMMRSSLRFNSLN